MIEINRIFDEVEQQFIDGVIECEREPLEMMYLLKTVAWYGQYVGIPKLVARMFVESYVPVWDAMQASFRSRDANAALTRLVFALKAYHRDSGHYPDVLDALLEGYLDELPLDPFSGTALRYVVEPPEGFLLYSVGPNGIDDEGRGHSDFPRGDDIRRRFRE